MKLMQIVKWVVVTLSLCTSVSQAELHEFNLPDGRSLEAEIVKYNAKQGQVELKLQNGNRKKINATVFVEEDQAYIREWDALKAFTSDRFLKISCDDKKVDVRKKEDWKNVNYTSGDVERELLKVTTFTKIAYEITFQNNNSSNLDGLRMEYVIYYEQSKETWDEPEVRQKKLKAKMEIPLLPSKVKTAIITKPVEIHDDNIESRNWTSGRSRSEGKGDVHGMRARFFMKTSSGKEVMREVFCPDSLSSKKFPWPAKD